MSLVTVEEINNALRLDLEADIGDGSGGDGGDTSRLDDIEMKLRQAEAIVLGFIQPLPETSWTHETVPGEVSAAIIIAVRCLLDDTDESLAMLSGLSGVTGFDARNPIVGLLMRRRTPSLA
ncbi:MAG: hypothetical protein KIS86_13460 [Devosia sp.]|nr:hypothetical protein [Devosia sp.]